MRDENGFKWYLNLFQVYLRSRLTSFSSHVQSESHVRQVLLIGENPRRYIQDFSQQFIRNFMELLRTTHGEKKVHINQFYQQVISDKEVSHCPGMV